MQNINSTEDIHTVIVDCAAVSTVDSSALKLVERVAKKYEERGVLLLFGNWYGVDAPGRRVMEFFKFDAFKKERMFFWLVDAIKYAREQKAIRDAKKAAAPCAGKQEPPPAEKKHGDVEMGGIEMQAPKTSL